jgi:hypothetical protein
MHYAGLVPKKSAGIVRKRIYGSPIAPGAVLCFTLLLVAVDCNKKTADIPSTESQPVRGQVQTPNVANPPTGAAVPAGEGARTEVPTAQTDEPPAEVTQLAQDMKKQTQEFNQQNWAMNNVFNDIEIGIASYGCAYMNSPEAKDNVSKLTSLSASMHAAEEEDLEITRRAETLGPLVSTYYPSIVSFYNQGQSRGKATHEKAERVYSNPCFK